jgi:hypothetical protein
MQEETKSSGTELQGYLPHEIQPPPRETRRMTKRRALFPPEIVLQGVRFPVNEVPLYRGELYDTYRGTSLIRHTCSRRTLR